MKPPLPLQNFSRKIILLFCISFLVQSHSYAQALSFKAPILESGSPLQIGSKYRFVNVINRVDALVTITNLVNGATIINLDTHAAEGYDAAFQPLISSPSGSTTSYALFTITFVSQGSTTSISLSEFTATALDIDGNATLKEFVEISFASSSPSAEYINPNSRIAVASVAHGHSGSNTDRIERAGIDTLSSNLRSMFSVMNSNVESLTLKLGAVTVGSTGENRVYSLYMKNFVYNNFAADNVVLPINLVAFTAVLNNSNVDLKWTTASEINTMHFIIEKSNDGIAFSDVGLIKSHGTATNKANYIFSDYIYYPAKIIYYRLRSVDQDGKSKLSAIRIIRIGKEFEKATSVLVYPNPVNNELRITIPAVWQNMKVMYDIIDLNGITVNRVQSNNSSQTQTINVSNLASGMYTVRTSVNGLVEQQQIIKK